MFHSNPAVHAKISYGACPEQYGKILRFAQDDSEGFDITGAEIHGDDIIYSRSD